MNPTALLECVSSMSCIVTQLSTGLIVGALLFLVAAGLTLIFGVLGIVNFAHGSFYMLGEMTDRSASVFVSTRVLLQADPTVTPAAPLRWCLRASTEAERRTRAIPKSAAAGGRLDASEEEDRRSAAPVEWAAPAPAAPPSASSVARACTRRSPCGCENTKAWPSQPCQRWRM